MAAIVTALGQNSGSEKSNQQRATKHSIYLIILGTVQDAGSPHMACNKECCAALFENQDTDRKVVSLGIVDENAQQTYLFEATPDITEQLKILKNSTSKAVNDIPNGIFLTHAHIGHYTGLMYLGKEASNTQNLSVYAMPKMKTFLKQNGPWSQLVNEGNIALSSLENQKELALGPNLKVIPFTVPHRDEYSETVGYKIIGPTKKALFIPDIDKWSRWKTGIASAIESVDYAFLDATFYDAKEINNRDISEIPHPFVIESMELLENLAASEKKKIHFIHFNHTNPLLNPDSEQSKIVSKKGFKIAKLGLQFEL